MQAAKRSANRAPSDVEYRRSHQVTTARLLEPDDNRAHVTETRTSVRPEWTVAELGQAAQGVAPVAFAAACYAYAGDRSGYWKLHKALYNEAKSLQRRQHWPREVLDLHGLARPYLQHLAKLVLDEDEHRNLFVVCEPLYAIYLGLNEDVWEKSVSARYGELKGVWLCWLDDAMRIIQPRLENDSA